jgi:hypothetical protein
MTNPREKEIIVEKINNGNVKVKGQKPKAKTQEPEKPKAEQPAVEQQKPASASAREKLEFTEEQIIEATRAVGHPAVSREISDKLGIKDADQGRAYVRSRMVALVKDEKIVTSKPEGKSRCTFLYSVA